MSILNIISLDSNKSLRFNFDGGELTSDAGLLLMKEFFHKIGFQKLVREKFHTNDNASYRKHTDADNLMQMIYQNLGGYFTDDSSDHLRTDPLYQQLLEKDQLASQPTISRFFSRMDEDTLKQFEELQRTLRKIVYSQEEKESVLFDIDTTLFAAYGDQEGSAFTPHYGQVGYHPILVYDGLTGDLLKAELRDGAKYCGKGSGAFMRSIMEEFKSDYPQVEMYLRGDSGFATPELYELCEEYGCKYVIRLKDNPVLHEKVKIAYDSFLRLIQETPLEYVCVYGEFQYQANSWTKSRRVLFKIEKPEDQYFTHLFTFIVTNLEELDAHQGIQLYCGRGKMENFIKESKNGFDLDGVSSSSKLVNANRLQFHALVYNLFIFFRRLVLPEKYQKLQADTLRLKLLKIAARVVHKARYCTFKLCSSFPFQEDFVEILRNIQHLQPILLE